MLLQSILLPLKLRSWLTFSSERVRARTFESSLISKLKYELVSLFEQSTLVFCKQQNSSKVNLYLLENPLFRETAVRKQKFVRKIFMIISGGLLAGS